MIYNLSEVNERKRILISYEYFYPGYKAGGPIQSLTNLVSAFGNTFDFYVFTSAYDLGATKPYDDIVLNRWNDMSIGNHKIKVWYVGEKIKYEIVKKLITEINPTHVYINGLYSLPFVIYPLIVCNKIKLSDNTIVAPRGMLQQGALAVKSTKKKVYLTALKLSGALKKITWHATTEDEKKDIEYFTGKLVRCVVAENIPKTPAPNIVYTTKSQGALKILYLSLISEKKNLLLLLQILKKCRAFIELDIFGPIKDNEYWNKCIEEMKSLPANISIHYRGDVKPENVQQTIVNYQALVLLTKGENFGHALYESLSVGRPIITSFFTPWNDLEKKMAGRNVDIANDQQMISVFEELAGKKQDEWNEYCSGAYSLSKAYFENQDFSSYEKLFA
ncbi:glycosyltransferase [Chitinophagaceae bacterium LWZ2-11]